MWPARTTSSAPWRCCSRTQSCASRRRPRTATACRTCCAWRLGKVGRVLVLLHSQCGPRGGRRGQAAGGGGGAGRSGQRARLLDAPHATSQLQRAAAHSTSAPNAASACPSPTLAGPPRRHPTHMPPIAHPSGLSNQKGHPAGPAARLRSPPALHHARTCAPGHGMLPGRLWMVEHACTHLAHWAMASS